MRYNKDQMIPMMESLILHFGVKKRSKGRFTTATPALMMITLPDRVAALTFSEHQKMDNLNMMIMVYLSQKKQNGTLLYYSAPR